MTTGSNNIHIGNEGTNTDTSSASAPEAGRAYDRVSDGNGTSQIPTPFTGGPLHVSSAISQGAPGLFLLASSR